jgi:hypothetical protein
VRSPLACRRHYRELSTAPLSHALSSAWQTANAGAAGLGAQPKLAHYADRPNEALLLAASLREIRTKRLISRLISAVPGLGINRDPFGDE